MSSDLPTNAPNADSKPQQRPPSLQLSSDPSPVPVVSKDTPSKITVLLKAAGNAPILKTKNWEMDESRTIAYLTQFLRKVLQLNADQSLFLFVNQSFSPSPDHTIGLLHSCYGGSNAKLTIHYSTTLAWG